LERFAELHGLETVSKKFDMQLNEEFGRTYAGKILYAGPQDRAAMFARNCVAVFGTWF